MKKRERALTVALTVEEKIWCTLNLPKMSQLEHRRTLTRYESEHCVSRPLGLLFCSKSTNKSF